MRAEGFIANSGIIRALTTVLYCIAMVATSILGLYKSFSRRIPAFGTPVLGKAAAAIALLFIPGQAFAQVVTTTNTTAGTIDENTTCSPNQPLVRTFTVTNSFSIRDVDIGVLATHTWRGDIQLTLQGPDGTRVRLTDGDTNDINGNNFNVLLDDSATQLVNTDGDTRNHSTTAPPYQNTYRPRNPLSAFNNRQSNGTWRLEICDLLPGFDDGQFRNATLTLRGPSADLSLSKTVSNASPTNGSNISYTLTVNSAAGSTDTATGVQVRDVLPAGFRFVSASGTGTYNSSTGLWTVGSVPVGANRSLTINGTVNASSGAVITNTAEIIASSVFDPDSTVNNGSTTEDDYATRSFTVSGPRNAGVAPQIVCPRGAVTFDWVGRSWPAGSLSNNYTLTGVGAFNWNVSSPSPFLNVAQLGGQQPALTNAAQNRTTLSKAIDFSNRSQFATTTITLGNVVDGAQLTIFDVDFAANDFADRVRVYGTRNGATVIPVLTNGVANYVIGNEAFGDAASAIDSADGNVIVTFQQAVDTIIIEYGNHSLAPADPDGQAIQMSGGISVCRANATLTVAKSSTVLEDPVNGTTDPFFIPGATVRYCILITNTGQANAANVSANDNLPATISFVPGSILSGTTCANAATIEDDDAAGADESDPAGASFSGTTVNFSRTSIAGGETAAVTFRATVN